VHHDNSSIVPESSPGEKPTVKIHQMHKVTASTIGFGTAEMRYWYQSGIIVNVSNYATNTCFSSKPGSDGQDRDTIDRPGES